MTLQFASHVNYLDKILLPTKLYPGIRVPPGVSVRMPTLIDYARMFKLEPTKMPPPDGLTDPTFSMRFSNFDQQWQRVQTGAAIPFWQFQGGVIHFQVDIQVYVIEDYFKRPDVFSIIVGHELLHVADEIDIINRYMPTAFVNDQYVKRYLIERRNVDDSTLQNWFRGPGFQEWIRAHIWIPEHHRRVDIRDASQEYLRMRKMIKRLN